MISLLKQIKDALDKKKSGVTPLDFHIWLLPGIKNEFESVNNYVNKQK